MARAWEQWRDPQGPFNHACDGLMLVTLGNLQTFDAAWREVKNACSGLDAALTMSRIRSNRSQSRILDSVQKPEGTSIATDEETIKLIRCLHVIPTDLQFAYSDTENRAIGQCRRLLVSAEANEAEALWKGLINVATDLRLGGAQSQLRRSGPFCAVNSRCAIIRISSGTGKRSPTSRPIARRE